MRVPGPCCTWNSHSLTEWGPARKCVVDKHTRGTHEVWGDSSDRTHAYETRVLTLWEGTERLLKRREMTCFLGQTTSKEENFDEQLVR